MAETELTKEMKRAIRYYKPVMNSSNRTIRWAEEVDVGTGYVDCIRFEDYIKNIENVHRCNKLDAYIDIKNPLCGDKKICIGCVYKSCELHKRQLEILMTCFEIKITKTDFKSKNGHNFVGNRNYYVIPKELYESVKNLVSDDIGIILYYGHGYLKMKKECAFKEIDKADLCRYLYNSMKKWCDMNVFMLEKFIKTGNM